MALDLGKMYGPLPLGAWLGAVGGGFAIMLYTRRQSQAEIPSNPDLQPEDTGVPAGVGTGAVGGWMQTTPPGQTTMAGPPETNEEWGREAIDRLVAEGYPPNTVNSAIYKYIQQTPPFSASEIAIINQAVREMGGPPSPVAGPVLAPPPVVKPPAPPPKPKPVPSGWTKHTIQRGQNMANIAAFYRAYPSDIWRANYAGRRRADGSIGWMVWYTDIEKHYGRKGSQGYLVIPRSITNRY